MFRKKLMISFLFILSHCSLNHPVSMWNVEDENTNSDITKLNFENETSYDEFKSNIIKYGELSKFPKLD
tara:strand:+ start:204 stop:410 length:207 start_codon:yes stop_codon:yes gene_type:complete